jgi:hypothetical protein
LAKTPVVYFGAGSRHSFMRAWITSSLSSTSRRR